MNDSSLSSVILPEAASPARLPRSIERFYLALVAALAGLGTAALLMFGVATQSVVDAERIADARVEGSGYLTALIGAFAAVHGRPKTF